MLLFADKLFNFIHIHENNLLFFEFSQKLKQINIIFLCTPNVKGGAVAFSSSKKTKIWEKFVSSNLFKRGI